MAPRPKGVPEPPVWRWRDDELADVGAVLVDIDGVLSDAEHRLHLVTGGGRGWDEFFARVGDDPLHADIDRLVRLLTGETAVVLVTGRPERIADQTIAWLTRFEVRWDLLVSRHDADNRPAPLMKTHAVNDLKQAGIEPLFALDDDSRNIAAYRDLGIPALHVVRAAGDTPA